MCCGNKLSRVQLWSMMLEKFFSAIGICAIVILIILGFKFGGFNQLMGVGSGIFLTADAYSSVEEMRDVSLNITGGCDDDEECIFLIYENLSSIKYAHAPFNLFVPVPTTWESQYGDCKAMSSLFVSIAVNNGIESYVSASIKHNHAVAVAYPRGKDYYYVIDLTGPVIQRFRRGVDHWSYY